MSRPWRVQLASETGLTGLQVLNFAANYMPLSTESKDKLAPSLDKLDSECAALKLEVLHINSPRAACFRLLFGTETLVHPPRAWQFQGICTKTTGTTLLISSDPGPIFGHSWFHIFSSLLQAAVRVVQWFQSRHLRSLSSIPTRLFPHHNSTLLRSLRGVG